MRLLRSRKWRTAAVTLAVVAVTIGGLVWRYQRVISEWAQPLIREYQYRHGSDPLLRDLANGTIRPGDNIETVLETHPTRRVVRYGPYTQALFAKPDYLQGPTLLARDGVLVAAYDSSCRGHVFFDRLGPLGWADYSQSLSDHIQQRKEAWAAGLGTAPAFSY